MQLLLQQQQLTNITINLFMDADRWGSGITAIEHEEEEDGLTHHNVQLEFCLIEGGRQS
jgi:hypothetical protein